MVRIIKNTYFTTRSCLFRTVNLTKHFDLDKYGYDRLWYWVQCTFTSLFDVRQ